jgi:hypothetical protein
MHDKLAALELLARMTGLLTRAPGRGRFALLQEDEERASRDARAELRARLMRIVHGQHEYIATTPATRSGTAENETQSDDRCGGGAMGG